MRRITVINMKGGCGKTTIATNLASAISGRGYNTSLIDYDPQGSSMYWLNQRSETASAINGLSAFPSNQAVTRSWQLRLPPETDYVIVDTPAGLSGLNLIDQLRGTHTIVIPVLPSSIDTHATADFIRDLYLIAKVQSKNIRLCIICNRVKANTLAFRSLERFLEAMKIPVIGSLRETQNYIKASDSGLGVLELGSKVDSKDINTWKQIVDWLEFESKTDSTKTTCHNEMSKSKVLNKNVFNKKRHSRFSEDCSDNSSDVTIAVNPSRY